MGAIKKKGKERPVSLVADRRRSLQQPIRPPPRPSSRSSKILLEPVQDFTLEKEKEEIFKPVTIGKERVSGKTAKFKKSLEKVWSFQSKIFSIGKAKNARTENDQTGPTTAGVEPIADMRGCGTLHHGDEPLCGESVSDPKTSTNEKRETKSFDLFYFEDEDTLKHKVVKIAEEPEEKPELTLQQHGLSIPIEGTYNLSSRFPRVGGVNPQLAAMERGEPGGRGTQGRQVKQGWNWPAHEVPSPRPSQESRMNSNHHTITPAQPPANYGRERAQTSQEQRFSPRHELPRRSENHTPPEFPQTVDPPPSWISRLTKWNIDERTKGYNASPVAAWIQQTSDEPKRETGQNLNPPFNFSNPRVTVDQGRAGDRNGYYLTEPEIPYDPEPRNLQENSESRVRRELPRITKPIRTNVNARETLPEFHFPQRQAIDNRGGSSMQVGKGGRRRETVNSMAQGISQSVNRAGTSRDFPEPKNLGDPRIPELHQHNLPIRERGPQPRDSSQSADRQVDTGRTRSPREIPPPSLPLSQSKILLREVIAPGQGYRANELCSQPGRRKGVNHFPRSATVVS